MTGQKIKDILRSEGITIADVARMLGHNGDQRLHSALKSEDVKSGLIEDIAREQFGFVKPEEYGSDGSRYRGIG